MVARPLVRHPRCKFIRFVFLIYLNRIRNSRSRTKMIISCGFAVIVQRSETLMRVAGTTDEARTTNAYHGARCEECASSDHRVFYQSHNSTTMQSFEFMSDDTHFRSILSFSFTRFSCQRDILSPRCPAMKHVRHFSGWLTSLFFSIGRLADAAFFGSKWTRASSIVRTRENHFNWESRHSRVCLNEIIMHRLSQACGHQMIKWNVKNSFLILFWAFEWIAAIVIPFHTW